MEEEVAGCGAALNNSIHDDVTSRLMTFRHLCRCF